VVFTVDASTATGHAALSSADIADAAAAHADVLIPFGSVDPLRGAAAVAQARSLVTDHGVRGFKFHPSMQAFAPNDPAFYPLWAEIAALGVPALFHTGQTGIGAGLPGGRGIKLRLSGWSPKYFPPELVRAANSFLQDKVLFGTDYPLLTPERWLRDFDALDIKPDVRPKILKDNAVRLLGLGSD
jgi:predicted TIM-barrel fold metal-dependent hydrolase